MRLAPGTTLDIYEIVAPLGAGGMGEVYRARDPVLKREVAIKVLPSAVSKDPERLRRFEQEAQATAALNHPNILAIHRFGVFEGAPYLVSELLEGSTLRQLMQRTPVPLRKAIDIAVQIAHGLAAAHEKGIVHRDLKPENLFVTKGGQVKILDFGLAKLTEHPSSAEGSGPTMTHVSEPGMVIGTAGYMSPEQVRGKAIDHRADIFAFGAILYEMLAGKQPFQRSTSADTMSAILNDDPIAISQLGQAIPPGLQRVVHRCLEKHPEQRFQSASDLAFALAALSDAGSSSGSPIAAPARLRARRVLAWATGSVVMLALAAGAYYFLRPQKKAPFEHYSIQRVIDSKHVMMTAISPDGTYLAAVIRNTDGHQALWIHHIATGSERPIVDANYAYQDVIFSPDGSYIYFRIDAPGTPRNEREDEYRIPVLGGQAAHILARVDAPLSFFDSGHRLCFYRENYLQGTYQFLSASADGSDEQVLAKGKKPFLFNPACAPDGRSAVSMADRAVLESLDFASGAKRKLPATALRAFDLHWAPDGKGLFATTIPKQQIDFLSYPSGNLREITNDLSHYQGISLTTDSKTIATTTYERNARMAELPLAKPSQLTEHPTGTMEWFEYLDNDRIVESDLTGIAGPRTVDFKTNETLSLNGGNIHFSFDPARCGPDTLVVSGTLDGKAISVYKVHLDGSAPTQLTTGVVDSFPECTADGKWLFYVDNREPSAPYLMRQPLQGGTGQRVDASSVWYDLSPDGKLLVHETWGPISRLQVISTDSLQELRSFPLPPDTTFLVAFSADSQTVFYVARTGADSTIWRQPLGAGAAVKVATLSGRTIVWIRPSPDGKKLGLTLTAPTSEAALIRDIP
jgi:serine/threonine protein kinase/Tol biopolymer transport system component